MTHCEEHSGVCEKMANFGNQLGEFSRRLDSHCANGGTGHVSRLEIKTLQEDVSTLTTAVREVVAQVAELQTERRTGSSIRQFWGPVLVAIVALAGQYLMRGG